MDITLEKPQQHDAEHAVIEALHASYNYWTEADSTHLVTQLAGYLFGNVTMGDFDEAASHYRALTTFDDEPLSSLARHYDEDEDPSLRLIREDEITQDLTATVNAILTIAGHKKTNVRRVKQLIEATNDVHTLAVAA